MAGEQTAQQILEKHLELAVVGLKSVHAHLQHAESLSRLGDDRGLVEVLGGQEMEAGEMLHGDARSEPGLIKCLERVKAGKAVMG